MKLNIDIINKFKYMITCASNLAILFSRFWIKEIVKLSNNFLILVAISFSRFWIKEIVKLSNNFLILDLRYKLKISP